MNHNYFKCLKNAYFHTRHAGGHSRTGAENAGPENRGPLFPDLHLPLLILFGTSFTGPVFSVDPRRRHR